MARRCSQDLKSGFILQGASQMRRLLAWKARATGEPVGSARLSGQRFV